MLVFLAASHLYSLFVRYSRSQRQLQVLKMCFLCSVFFFVYFDYNKNQFNCKNMQLFRFQNAFA
jgi:hypothetical protein